MSNIWMVLQQTAAVSLVAGFLLVLQKLFEDKLSPKWRYTVWLVLLCRLVVPAGWGKGTTLDISGWVDTLRVWGELKLSSAWSSPWQSAIPTVPAPLPPTGGAPASLTDWLFVVYLTGAAVCALWLILGWLGLRAMAKKAAPVTDKRWEQVCALAGEMGMKPPKAMVESEQAHGPFLMGVLSPVLVVPMGWQVEEKVVLHELIHLKNQDVAAGWLTALFRCVHWCNPFLWWVFDRVDNQREQRCDQQVLERLEGEDRRDYGRVLLSMAEDKVVRVPGATSMANGAERVKERIQAIARFKSYPQGMGLVSMCMALLLIPHLVVGFPAVAAEEELEHDFVAQTLSYAQRNPCTTVAGALDAYAKGMYYEIQSPNTALLARAMIAPEGEMAQALADYEADWDRWGKGTLRHKELEQAYRTGPLFRGLTPVGEDRWVCQVFMFRDDPDWQPGAEVGYLCHTVEITRQADGRHTVEKLGERTGKLDKDENLVWDDPLGDPPIVWRGSAAGVEVMIYPMQKLIVQGGWVNGATLDMWSALEPGWEKTSVPDPDANFGSCYGASWMTVTNRNDARVDVTLSVRPDWADENIDPSGNFTANDAGMDRQLAPGETVEEYGSGGGATHKNGLELEQCLCPDRYTAALTVNGVEHELVLTKEGTW